MTTESLCSGAGNRRGRCRAGASRTGPQQEPHSARQSLSGIPVRQGTDAQHCLLRAGRSHRGGEQHLLGSRVPAFLSGDRAPTCAELCRMDAVCWRPARPAVPRSLCLAAASRAGLHWRGCGWGWGRGQLPKPGVLLPGLFSSSAGLGAWAPSVDPLLPPRGLLRRSAISGVYLIFQKGPTRAQ